ncbi:MAG TPA: PilN domain-containing protein [Solirubrobacterales bacterium]|nr:PilN domain-containing protein [Solirubrobacterales bacterium]
MRPVNLIPPEQRHGSQSPLRTGPLPYLLLGGLVALLIGVALLVVTGNQISERKSEVVTLKQEDAAAQKQAEELAPYVQLAQLRQARTETVNSLADSRFDWERVMRELSKILPPDVWLTTLHASASPEAASGSGSGSSTESSGGSALRGSIAGPALEINGCANGQDGVAGFVTALKQIDGVTRVGVQSSALPTSESAAASGEGSGGGGTDCRTRNFIAQFEIVVAFDAAPVAAPVEATEVEATEAAPEGSEESSESSEESSTEG